MKLCIFYEYVLLWCFSLKLAFSYSSFLLRWCNLSYNWTFEKSLCYTNNVSAKSTDNERNTNEILTWTLHLLDFKISFRLCKRIIKSQSFTNPFQYKKNIECYFLNYFFFFQNSLSKWIHIPRNTCTLNGNVSLK